jgi:hypothetical protein
MIVWLISEYDYQAILGDQNCSSIETRLFQNNNLQFPNGYWVSRLLVDELGLRLQPLATYDCLPVFFGSLDSQQQDDYKLDLTALCISRSDGSSIKGVSYLEPYDDYFFCRDLGRCFRYGLDSDYSHYWRVIGHSGDIKWLSGYWGEVEPFGVWLATIGANDSLLSE